MCQYMKRKLPDTHTSASGSMDKRQAVGSGQSAQAESGKQQEASSGQWEDNRQQQAVSSRQQAASDQRAECSGKQRAASGKQRAASSEQRVVGSRSWGCRQRAGSRMADDSTREAHTDSSVETAVDVMGGSAQRSDKGWA
ncbi:hypothetical protein GGX14DRAFT_398680 [Mycena pura]|uniref:Uncharacterized protein n=1 Tax=Mycena pura TaxID=153505 RepID=A0AAD6Y7F7_9AGAR|nr:hypothetical protein GGX14DRAFT_398680 [Mycena pura]